jgi:hypothetical protein
MYVSGVRVLSRRCFLAALFAELEVTPAPTELTAQASRFQIGKRFLTLESQGG